MSPKKRYLESLCYALADHCDVLVPHLHPQVVILVQDHLEDQDWKEDQDDSECHRNDDQEGEEF